eukprot:gnl/TRDRNA2_/TRDRNA2_125790_c0_seq5.p1 gnl/TRDRNA2_/TRDRNA2_125790_c0~~gnl/TRDRNA2_/TRDRNA2_125790_c0_seq5.p1  ORF type:complete len:324 (-),score=47.44 gnl/TRDRNA2_/TRDRNA2_125790_c0_seq5:213-1184(-)
MRDVAQTVMIRIANAFYRAGVSSQEYFEKIDVNKDGVLSFEEVAALARFFEPSLSNNDVSAIFVRFDHDGNSLIDGQEFKAAIENTAARRRHQREVAHTVLTRIAVALYHARVSSTQFFEKIDLNKDGALDFLEVEAFVRTFEPSLSNNDILALCLHLDHDGNSLIDEQEFKTAIESAAARKLEMIEPMPVTQDLCKDTNSQNGFIRGKAVQYFCDSRHHWIDCHITMTDPASGAIQVSEKPGCWLWGSALSTKIRIPCIPHDYLESGNILRGEAMQYYCSSRKRWIDCRVTEVDPDTGEIQVSVQPGLWLDPRTDLGVKIRH